MTARPLRSTPGRAYRSRVDPDPGSTARVCEWVATYITPPTISGWLDALAELSRLRFQAGASRFTLAGVMDVRLVWRCWPQPMP